MFSFRVAAMIVSKQEIGLGRKIYDRRKTHMFSHRIP